MKRSGGKHVHAGSDEARSSHGVLPLGARPAGRRPLAGRVAAALSGAIGAISGIAPHVLHHVGPIAGAAFLTGIEGSALFGALGLALTIPMLLRLRRRFGTWVAPGIALALFAATFSVSTFVIGPAIRGDDRPPVEEVQPADPHGH